MAPYEVDHQGRYISHAVAHQHRRKRSTDGQGHDPTVHFRFHGLGQDFHLDLQPSHDLMAPSFTVQTLGMSGTKSLQTFPQDDLCFYQGVLRSKVNSYVALSTCAGMVSGLSCFWADWLYNVGRSHFQIANQVLRIYLCIKKNYIWVSLFHSLWNVEDEY